ncbi:MAG: O-acetyl-ADP-ribose deacetylase [Dokdonella sp.]|uniref:O-acetyl-ADP-ribose deacetylase n=1 Tax=Dokdonella sp. TaxID=2291710 RepID=UPI003F7F2CEB
MNAFLSVVEADITTLAVDAIVNAANESLLGGGGVDGAIHRAAGPALLAACRALPEVRPGVRCPTGEARMTAAFALPARHVIHTVGPVWRGGERGEADLLAACYRSTLAVAREHGVATIAFPAISCGVYGYPVDAATAIAVREARAWLARHERAACKIVFCAFGAAIAGAYRRELARAALPGA